MAIRGNKLSLYSGFLFQNGLFPKLSSPLLGAVVREMSELNQAPKSMNAAAVIASIATAVQRLFNVTLLHGDVVPVSLLVFILAESGERKGSVFRSAMKSHFDFQHADEIAFKKELDNLEVEMEIYSENEKILKQKLRSAIKNDKCTAEIKKKMVELKATKPKAPRSPNSILENITPEALVEELEFNPNVFFGTSEGGVAVKGRSLSDTPAQNAIWSGESYSKKIKTGEKIHLTERRLTSLIMTQMNIFEQLMSRNNAEARDNGYFSRCLVCFPISNRGKRSYDNYRVNKEHTKLFHERITYFLNKHKEQKDPLLRKTISFSYNAANILEEIAEDIETMQGQGDIFEKYGDHASKLVENISRVAALIQIFEYPDSDEIEEDSLIDAIQVVMYFSHDFIDLFKRFDPFEKALDKAMSKIIEIQQQGDYRYIALQHLYKNMPSGLRLKSDLMPVLERLQAEGELRFAKIGWSHSAIDMLPTLQDDKDKYRYDIGAQCPRKSIR